MKSMLISGRTKTELYKYLKTNGGSYSDLRVSFEHSDIREDTNVVSHSTTNKNRFLDMYIQPLKLDQLEDAYKLVRFIEQIVEFPKETSSPDLESEILLQSLKEDGWEISNHKISWPSSRQPSPLLDVNIVIPTNIEELLENLFKGFGRAIHPLKNRRKNAPFLSFENEYDVQDLLHSLLRPWIRDVRSEEYTPSYAGSSTRIDFLLPQYEIVIEVKFIRDATHAKKIGDELIIDIAHYKAHPKCNQCPNDFVQNPSGLVSDLETYSDKVAVRTFVVNT